MKILISILLFSCSSFALIEVQGHRGARSVRPENTMAAFEYALKVGVDTIEMDLAVTKDEILVVSHDPYINPSFCLGPKGQEVPEKLAIRTLNYKQIKSYNCGAKINPKFPKQVLGDFHIIPTLRNVFKWIKKQKTKKSQLVKFNIETKLVPGMEKLALPPKVFAKKLIELIKEFNLTKRTTIQSFDHRTLREAKALEPTISIAALIGGTLPNLRLIAKDLKADIISPYYLWINKKTVQELKKDGVRVIPWTANEEKVWRNLIDYGVDGIITDDPAALIKYLKFRGLR